MRVLFVAHSFPRHDGDAPGSFLLRLARALRDEDVEVHVLAPSAPGLAPRETIGGVPVHRFRYAPSRSETLAYTGTMAGDVAASWGAKAALGGLVATELASTLQDSRALGADIVHAHWWFPNGLAAAGAATVSGIPLVTTSHGSDLRLLAHKAAAAPLARFVFRRSATVTCVSTWLAEQARQYTSHAPIVAPMPADTDLFTPAGERDNATLLFVGRLSEQKGATWAVRALARMRATATLHLVGDGPEREDVLRLAHELGVADRISMQAAASQPELAEMYRRATALVVPSIDEGLGLVAVEAQLCETPVVAFDSGGLRDVVHDGATGLLAPPGDPNALAAALDTIVTQPSLARELGTAGRTAALAVFSPRAAAAAYAGIYHNVLQRNAA